MTTLPDRAADGAAHDAPGAATPRGLTAAEAAQRLAHDGPNALPRPAPRTLARIALEVLREPMFQLLAGAVALYLLLGDVGEAAVLGGFLGVIVAITLVQERRTERVLEALHDMTSPRALVWRDGAQVRVPGTQVVRGDLIALSDGDRVPADARLVIAHDLALDESMLTGESLPVAKQPGDGAAGQVFAGTLVVDGQATAEVTATGERSEIGRIGKTLGGLPAADTPLRQQTARLVRVFSVVGLVISAAVAGLFLAVHGDWVGAALAGITMAMSMLPQEFLLILTVFMAMGAWRLSQYRVLTRRPATIEALGAATVLCTDKTGTLTHNRMAVAALVACETAPDGAILGIERWQPGGGAMPPAVQHLLLQAVRASEEVAVDPMERALHALAGDGAADAIAGLQLVHEHGLSAALPVMTHVWHDDGPGPALVAVKGAPESVADLCRLPPARRGALLAEAQHWADRGMRVLAVAAGTHALPDAARAPATPASSAPAGWPDGPAGYALDLLGLVALADPLRDTVPQAVAECRRAGIRVVMITGDHPSTAAAIARQAGIDVGDGVLLGSEVAAVDDAALRERVARTTVYARVPPAQKLRIVQALQARGEVVAMTGDGVNDAPSLKAAHIGIAMGGRGTDVAREAASLVLLDDDFGSIVRAVRLGRRIFDNLGKAMRFVLAVHVPIAGMALAPLLLGWPVFFTPMHIAFLEILIDPVCSMAFEAEDEEPDLMDRPPRDPAAPMFSHALIAGSLGQGAVILAAVAAFYGTLLHLGDSAEQARAAGFVGLVLCSIALIAANRSRSGRLRAVLGGHNRMLGGILAATVALLAATLAVPPLRELFRFDLPTAAGAWGALALAVVVLTGLLLTKRRPARAG